MSSFRRGSTLPDVWGATPQEVTRTYACDRIVPDTAGRLLRAVDSSARPDRVFAWLCQLRFAPYSYDWVDNWGRRSPRELASRGRSLAIGQRFMTIFRLVSFVEGQELTIALRGGAPRQIFGDVAVTYRVEPQPGGSRLVAVLRTADPAGPLPVLRRRLLAWGDLFMMRKQLITLTRYAERSP